MLRRLHDDLHIATHPIDLPAARMTSTMSVLRLEGGGLVLCSPVPIDEALAARIDALGEVRAIVAPNAFHHLFLDAAIARYPKARLFGSAAVAKKRSDLRFSHLLEGGLPKEWEGQLEARVVEGAPSVGELILFHPASEALILTDLVFHLSAEQPLLGALMFRLLGIHGRLAQSKSWQWIFAKDPGAVAASVRPIWSWGFTRVVVGHGEPVLKDAKPRLLQAMLPWMLDGSERP